MATHWGSQLKNLLPVAEVWEESNFFFFFFSLIKEIVKKGLTSLDMGLSNYFYSSKNLGPVLSYFRIQQIQWRMFLSEVLENSETHQLTNLYSHSGKI